MEDMKKITHNNVRLNGRKVHVKAIGFLHGWRSGDAENMKNTCFDCITTKTCYYFVLYLLSSGRSAFGRQVFNFVAAK